LFLVIEFDARLQFRPRHRSVLLSNPAGMHLELNGTLLADGIVEHK
jgi:hypothetical protein